MKTLDEVIDYCEGKQTCGEWVGIADALHYLKEYRKLDSLDAVAFSEDDNPPLSWDELKDMIGQPVWVEHDTPSTKYQRWVLVCEYTDTNKITIIANHLLTQIMPDDYGNTWQAYRKERK